MKNLLCLIGLHSKCSWDEWEPSMMAPVVTRVAYITRCRRCDYDDRQEWIETRPHILAYAERATISED